jgi:ATP-dependent DNA helicase RecG
MDVTVIILKVSVPKVTEKVTENEGGVTEKVTENGDRVTEKLQKIVEKSQELGEELTDNRIKILRAIIENPYIAKSELVKVVGISYTSIGRNIEVMRNKYLRRVGADKGGFWEVIE